MKGEMVTLTYHTEVRKEGSSSRSSRGADPDSVESEEGAQEGPKTAYIDKLYKFKEDDADEEKCDLFFICQDGEVPAHRLVISNASKYIMAMQDDQPPWYPVYISVPDLPKLIVQTLVQLAYTGKMIIPPSSTSDELLDAMQALGWIHTDCLTASFTDSMAPVTDEDIGCAISSKTSESLEAVLKMKLPLSKEAVGLSDGEDEGGMEMDLPNVPMSDEDEVTANRLETTPKKKQAPNTLRGRRSARNSPRPKATKTTSTPPKSVPASPKTTRRKVASPVPEAETNNEKPSKDVSENAAKAESEAPKRGRKGKMEKPANPPTKASTSEESRSQTVNNSEAEPESSQEPETVRSRTRTIRKPKKFDDLIVMTPTKRKESPVKASPTKSPTKVVNSPTAGEVENKKASNSTPAATKKTTGPAVPKALPKGRRSTSIETNKITSYFSKRSVSKEDVTDPVNNNTEPVQNSEEVVPNTTTNTGTSKSGKSSRVDESSDSLEDNGIQIIGEKISDNKEKDTDTDTSSSTLRRRAKSNASAKSDKEAGPQETSNSNHDESGTSKTGAGRRKRNFEESEEVEPDAEGGPIPKRRGRKPSTISNASKSSKASNQDSTVDGDMDAPEGAPKRKRTRQD